MARNLSVICALLVTGALISVNANDLQLKLVNVLFRHGDRTPSEGGMYPHDPYYNSDFYPYGLGELTSEGKMRAFGLGKFLRERYNEFLGDIYEPETVKGQSSAFDRTKMSLQLVLASLYPPKGVQKWHASLGWQPIPITVTPQDQDKLLLGIKQPSFRHENARVNRLPKVKEALMNIQPIMHNLTILTGKNITTPKHMYSLYQTLTSERHMNLTLPSWTKSFFPEGPLLEGHALNFAILGYDTGMKKALNGPLLGKLSSDMQAVKNRKMDPKRKMFLYSAHDVNVNGLLQSLDVYKGDVAKYSSAVILELFQQRDKFFVKVLYYHGIPTTTEIEELRLPRCSILCPLERFVELTSEISTL